MNDLTIFFAGFGCCLFIVIFLLMLIYVTETTDKTIDRCNENEKKSRNPDKFYVVTQSGEEYEFEAYSWDITDGCFMLYNDSNDELGFFPISAIKRVAINNK